MNTPEHRKKIRKIDRCRTVGKKTRKKFRKKQIRIDQMKVNKPAADKLFLSVSAEGDV